MKSNFKDLFDRVKLILLKPAEAWKKFSTEGKQKVLQAYVYPLLALSAIADFIGRFFMLDSSIGTNKAIQIMLTNTASTVISLFGGLFLACLIIETLSSQVLQFDLKRESSLKLVGYGLTLTFLNYIVVSLIPDFRLILFLLQIYTIYILWEGVPVLLPIHSKKGNLLGKDLRLSITITLFFVILLAPMLVGILFSILTKLLN